MLGAAALAIACAGTASASDCVTPGRDRLVTLDCRGVPLGTVLRSLGAVVPIDITLVEPAAQAVPVYVAVDAAPVGQALQATLDAAGISFVLYGTEGPDLRVFAASPAGGPSPAVVAAKVAANTEPSKDSPVIVEDEIAAGAKAAADVSAGPAVSTAEDILFRGAAASNKPKN